MFAFQAICWWWFNVCKYATLINKWQHAATPLIHTHSHPCRTFRSASCLPERDGTYARISLMLIQLRTSARRACVNFYFSRVCVCARALRSHVSHYHAILPAWGLCVRGASAHAKWSTYARYPCANSRMTVRVCVCLRASVCVCRVNQAEMIHLMLIPSAKIPGKQAVCKRWSNLLKRPLHTSAYSASGTCRIPPKKL